MNPLSHLPQNKQEELSEIVKLIREIADPAKIILFGSHTSDRWVEDEYEDRGATYSYISDYDILVVLSDKDKGRELDITSRIENRTESYKNDVVPIVHTAGYIMRDWKGDNTSLGILLRRELSFLIAAMMTSWSVNH